MRVYYNENNKQVAAWLRELIVSNLIPAGEIDTRSIVDVDAESLKGFTACHFFAGIGGWAYALRLAEWPEEKEVWTGSCPCQPFSIAGKAKGLCDERHLWPAFQRLIAKRNPATVFGEQVASKDGRAWLAGIRADLERMGYAVGGADLCAAGVGAPHPRQRLYWLADAVCKRRGEVWRDDREHDGRQPDSESKDRSSGVDNPADERTIREIQTVQNCDGQEHGISGSHGGLGKSNNSGSQRHGRLEQIKNQEGREIAKRHGSTPGSRNNFWEESKWIECEERKGVRVIRRIPAEPILFPLAHGVSGRVGLLRGAGNAIVPEVAEEFIRSYLEIK